VIAPQVAVDKLAGIGPATAIAAHFVEIGLLGHRSSTSHCVVARWLKAQTGAAHLSLTHRTALFVFDDDEYGVEIDLPADVSQVIRLFDLGRYPELVA
jgi:hypothetical protein